MTNDAAKNKKMTRREALLARFSALKAALAERLSAAFAPREAPPSAAPGSAPPSLARQALRLSALLVALFVVISGAVLFAVAYDEAADHQDDVLEETAGMLARSNVVFWHEPPAFEVLYMDDDDFEDRFLLRDSDPRAGVAKGEEILVNTLHKTGRALRLAAENYIPGGHSTIEIDGESWRILVVGLTNGNRVAVAQKMEDVWEEAAMGAVMSAVPILILTVLLSVMLALLLWRMTAPVRRLQATIAGKTGEDLTPVVDPAIPAEIQPLVEAVNGLLSRIEELRLREARFVADAAHELRSPLAALSLQAERLSKEPLSDSARERLQKLREIIDRAVRQVSQLLALKRAQSGARSGEALGAHAQPAAADVAQAVGRAVEDVWPELERKSLEFEAVGLEDGAHQLLMPADDLFTILRNLLENAARYTPEGGAVRLKFDAPTGRITVSDSGPGIPEEERGRVFDPFYRVLGTGVTGTGLGLAIVKTLADKNGFAVTLGEADPLAPEGARGLAVTLEPRP